MFLRLYKSYLLPLLEYANLCWVPNNSQCYQIESVERQVTKFICYKNGFCDISYEKRLESLNLDSIQMRRETNILIFVFKCIHNYEGVPNIWKNIFKTNDTRNGLMLEIPKTRIKICDKNFFINAMKLFNSLPKIIRNETEFSLYLKNVKIFITKNIVFK